MLKWFTSLVGLTALPLVFMQAIEPAQDQVAVQSLTQTNETSSPIENAMLAAGPMFLSQSTNHTVRNTIINNASVNHTVRNTIINNASVNHTVRNTIINNASVNHTVQNTVINNVNVSHVISNGSASEGDASEVYAADMFSRARASLVNAFQRFMNVSTPFDESQLPVANQMKAAG